MSSVHKLVIAGMTLIAIAAMSGCGEREQVIVYQQGKYQGKPDTRPWENEPGTSIYTTSKWTKGDKTSWDAAIKARNQNQNEYTRTE